MCVSTGPAEFSGTILMLYRLSAMGWDVLGYQNVVKSIRHGINGDNGARAMIIHFPTGDPMGPENILDTSKCPNILKDMATAVQNRSRGIQDKGLTFGMDIRVFDHDIYRIVMVNSAEPSEVMAALQLVPPEKRPLISEDLVSFYQDVRPGFKLAFCCFNNRDAQEASPMLWKYRPFSQLFLTLPGIDCHTGGVPDLDELVHVDTTVLVSSDMMYNNGPAVRPVFYTDDIPAEVAFYLPTHVVGKTFHGDMPNGDWYTNLQVLESGESHIIRDKHILF